MVDQNSSRINKKIAAIVSLFFILANEWHAPSKHSVQHDAEGPNISFTRMRLLGDNLR